MGTIPQSLFFCLELLTLAPLEEMLLSSNGNAMKVSGGPVPGIWGNVMKIWDIIKSFRTRRKIHWFKSFRTCLLHSFSLPLPVFISKRPPWIKWLRTGNTVILYWHSKVGRSPVHTDPCEKRMCSASRLSKVAWKSIEMPREAQKQAASSVSAVTEYRDNLWMCHLSKSLCPGVPFMYCLESWECPALELFSLKLQHFDSKSD